MQISENGEENWLDISAEENYVIKAKDEGKDIKAIITYFDNERFEETIETNLITVEEHKDDFKFKNYTLSIDETNANNHSYTLSDENGIISNNYVGGIISSITNNNDFVFVSGQKRRFYAPPPSGKNPTGIP